MKNVFSKMTYNPLYQLSMARIRQFFREPEAIFWTYGFPLVMIVGMGIAFRNKPDQPVQFTWAQNDSMPETLQALLDNPRFEVTVLPTEEALDQLRKNKTPLVVSVNPQGQYEYHFDPTNPESKATRLQVDDAVQRHAGRLDVLPTEEKTLRIPGQRYIDWLVPGLIGMNLMSGGLWGIGFVLVDMRVKNLLKRLLATPMHRRDFLMSMVGVRALFFIPEMLFLLVAAYLLFEVPLRGSLMAITLIAFVGSVSFAGLGLLTACRAKRIETISGLMNLVMLPMWLMSGVFFSADRFPDAWQPLIQALPLTQLINALRAVMLDGSSLLSQSIPLVILIAWGGISFALALLWFRWHE